MFQTKISRGTLQHDWVKMRMRLGSNYARRSNLLVAESDLLNTSGRQHWPSNRANNANYPPKGFIYYVLENKKQAEHDI